MSKTPTYNSWNAMKQRVLNPKHVAYERYQQLGVSIDPRWMTFANFYTDMGERPIGTSLERRDNRKGYYKENCYWADRKQQMNNTRYNHSVTVGSVTMTVAQWAEYRGLKPITIYSRLYKGWTAEDAIFTTTEEGKNRASKTRQLRVAEEKAKHVGGSVCYNEQGIRCLTLNGRTLTIREWSNEIGVIPELLDSRIRRGWPVVAALAIPQRW